MKTLTRLRKNDGFTLIEAMVASAILVVALLGFLEMIEVGYNTSMLHKQKTTALVLAEEKMEEIKALNPRRLDDWRGLVLTDTVYRNGVTYSRRVTYLDRAGQPAEQFITIDGSQAFYLYDVSVTVNWEYREITEQVELRTLITGR
ncbi:MAG: prepilin-type N-terminal cleavage/methylation domain-containing protein [Firmicutes bacterium]|nr:prepilin-type N-terminal cleavage/methylation domain-containing protein [Bacillota bacterium]